jgi:hypothetical protein
VPADDGRRVTGVAGVARLAWADASIMPVVPRAGADLAAMMVVRWGRVVLDTRA